MRCSLFPFFFFILLQCPCFLLAEEDPEVLRSKLSRIYSEWRAALTAKSTTAWQNYTSTYRQVLTRNMIVSQGQVFPDALFSLPMSPPDTLKLRLLEAEANGPTAHLIYFGPVDLGLEMEDVPDNMLVLKFFQEKSGWKFDSSKMLNLGESPEMRESIKNGDLDFLKHAPFNPPGELPAVPKLCQKPEYVAALRVHAVGYQVVAQCNGFDFPAVENNAEQHLMMGGLKRGPTPLRLLVKEVPLPVADADKILSVEVIVLTGKEERPIVKVFRWEPEIQAVGTVELTVTLDNGTLRGL
jgi:hypothetical protein